MALVRLDLDPSQRELRRFAGIAFPAFCGLLGGLVAYSTGSLRGAAWIWGAGLCIGLAGLRSPIFARIVYTILLYAAFPIGYVVSYLVLGAIFFLVIMPIGLLARLVGRDALARELDRDADTYWECYDPKRPPEDYFRQF